jgi:hypothetical protein
MTFTVTLDRAVGAGETVTIDWALNDNLATVADNDYVDDNGTLTYTAGEITKNVVVAIQPDAIVEGDEDFTLDLTVTSGNILPATDQATGWILNDDYTIATFADESVSENWGPMTFTITLDRAVGAGETVTIDYTTTDGTAKIADNDYVTAANTLTFGPGEITKTVDVTIQPDPDREPDETFTLDLTVTSGNVLPVNQSATGTILNDDYVIAIFNDVDVTEDVGKAIFTVTLDRAVADGVKVRIDYTTNDGTATAADNDYNTKAGTLTFNKDDISQTIDVTITDDGLVELDETFTVDLTVISGNATPANPSATGTILVDDAYDISIADSADVAEGGLAVFTVTITPAVIPGDTVTVGYKTVDGTATMVGGDYSFASGTLTFNPGEANKDINVSTINDNEVEFVETFSVQLPAATTFADAAFSDNIGDCNILVDDQYKFVIDDITENENVGNAVFTVSVTPAIQVGHTVTIDYTTNDGTAEDQNGSNDYTLTSGILTFNPADMSHTIAVPITDDVLVEFEEIFVVDLSNSLPMEITNIVDPQGECNILIDELYEIAILDTSVGEGDGNATFTMTVNPAIQAGDSVGISYTTMDGSAEDQNGSNDYTLTTGTLFFNPGDTLRTVDVPITNDPIVDPSESFDMLIGLNFPPAITTITDDKATCPIVDNDLYLEISKTGSGDGDLAAGNGVPSGMTGGTAPPIGLPMTFVYEVGDTVSLDATPYPNPYPGSVFGGWSGDHTDASANTTITMDTHKQVTADFIQQYYIAPIISTMGSISPAGVAPPVPDPTISGHVIVLHGANQPFSITPAALDWNVVTDVLEDGTSVGASAVPAVPVIGGNSYTFMNVTANHTIGANYDDHGGVCPGSYTTLDPAGNDPQIEVVNGDLSSGGDQDMFKVVLPSRGIITIYTEGNTDTYGHLLDSGCTTLSENDERSQIDSNFFIQESMDAGTYFIRVRHYFSTTGTGAYRLYVKFDPDDHGSNCNTATTVDRNSTTAGVIVTGGDEDYFKVVMPAQGIITTYTTGTTDTFGLFLDSNCNVITQNENSGDGDNFRIVRDVGPGTYHVEVRHSDIIAGTGTYNLVVESVLTHIIAASSGYGGTISPSGGVSVPEGGSQSFDILSSGVNAILKLEVDGTEIGAAVGNTSYTYGFTNVTTNHTIHVTFDLPQDACLDISDTPLDARYRAAPANIMFVMDDSGSMDWTFMTDDGDGLFRTDGNTYRYVFDDAGDNARDGWILPRGNRRMHWQSQWYEYNRIYYNPNVDYQPWPTLDNADPDNPRSHPYHENPTFDLELLYDTINTGAGAGIIVDNEDAEFTKTPDTVDIIINDRDPEFSKTASSGGEWRNANSDEAYNGEHYFTRRNGNYTAKWTPNLTAGDYKVYARWRDRDSYSTNVPYTINHAGGSDTVYVNQEINGGKWYELGTYTFNAGTGGNVEMIFTRTSSNASACADAVRFVPMSNAWDWSTSTQAQQDNYFYTPSAGTYTATWTPNIDLAGSYEVSARWVSDPNRSTAVPYTINHAGGSDTVNVDQRQNGGQWVVLGTYNFNAGTGGNVTIDNFTVNDPDTERIVADSVRIVPGGIPATIRIYRSHYYVWSETNSKPYLVNIGLNQIRYFEFTDDGDDVIEVGELLPVVNPNDVPDDVRTDRTYLEERQNFANWYSFYRRRELTATAAIANVIVSMQGVNIGFASINDRLIQPVLPVNVGTDDSTDTLLDRLYGYVLLSASTPLRQGLQAVGQYFHADDGQTGGIGASPYETAENGGECQQAFAIVMTDGYWNGGSPNVGNTDKDEAGDPDNSIYDGPPYEDNWSNTLADVAMHYYETDLSPNDLTMDDGNPGLNDLVPTNKLDEASFQHMATYTVSFGVFGTLNPADYDLESSDSADWPTWPDPFNGSDQRNIDDLWHAAVNGRGTFSSAANPVELLDALLSIMQNIEARIGSASSVSINGDELYDEVSSDIRMFQASYNSDGWTGDVKAHQVDLETGSVEVDSYIWSAAAKLEDITPTARIIATYDGSQGIPFRYDDPGMTTELKDMLDASDATNAERMLNYLRGDTTYEEKNGGTFRNRIQKLGDIVHSSPTHKNGYLYAGGNDGMLHVFDATDGKEVFAYVPKLVFENLKNLSDPLYRNQQDDTGRGSW